MTDDTSTPAPDERPEKRVGEPRTAFVPNASIEFTADQGLRIVLDKTRLGDLFDQGEDMLDSAGQGCISTPTGPRC